MEFYIFFIPLLFVLILFLFKVKIKWKTFFEKGFVPKRCDFGLYNYCGPQGNGKTYSLVEFLEDNKNHIICYSNVEDIKINGLNINYYHGYKELLNIINMFDDGLINIPKDYKFVILYDELFSEFVKGSKVDDDFIEFLSQIRKRKLIILTTCQYWAELPISVRRFCRYQIECKMINLLFFGILWKRFRDGENIKWNEQEQDFVAPLIENTFSKCRINVAKSYSTNQIIKKVKKAK